jgi:hypothetical protein
VFGGGNLDGYWIEERIPRTLRAHGAAMLATAPNPTLIRVVLIVLFLIISQFLRAKKSSSSKPASGTGAGAGSQVGGVLRDAMRKAAEQVQERHSGETIAGVPEPVIDQFQQPPSTEPESSFIPSFLLLALLVCLCLMAYRYWVR